MANAVIGDNGELLEYKHLIANPKTRATWTHSYGNELGRLAQGMPGRNTGTNTIFFIKKDQVPKERAKDVTYGLITTLIRPEKIDEPNRTRLVAGGDRVHYPGDAGTPTADLLTVKLLLNSIISTENARFMTMDIKDFYLNTPMARYEYMRLRLADMPEDVIEHYKLREIATPDGAIYCEIRKGMYGLPQAGIIAQQLLEERLTKHGYHQSTTTPGLWKHDTRPICFSLVVDDFGVKYVGEEHAQHLLETIRSYYKCSADWEGERYCGLTLKWATLAGRYISRCRGTSTKPSPVSNTRILQSPNTNRIPTSKSTMVQRHNTRRRRTNPPPWTRLAKSLSRRSAEFSFSLHEESMAVYSPPSAPSRPSNRIRRKKQ
jgi:hypothetical protein